MELNILHLKEVSGITTLFTPGSSFRFFSRLIAPGLFFFALTASVAAQAGFEDFRASLAGGDSEAKRTVLFQIRNLRSAEASRIAVPALADKDDIVRATAAGSVVFLLRPEAAAALLPLLEDKAEIVRREAAFALGTVGDPASVRPLVALLENDKIIEVKGAAALALGRIGDPSAVDVLVRLLQGKRNEDTAFLRRSAARSIGQIAQFTQTGRIDDLTPQNFLPEKYKRFDPARYTDLPARFPAFHEALRVLTRVLQSASEDDDTRREAAYALGTIGDPSSAAMLRAHLSSPDTYLAEICREALLRLQK